MKTCCAVIILGHGTTRKEASEGFCELVARVGRRLAPARVLPACFSCGRPTLYEQTSVLARENVTRVIIFPYFLLSGRHIADELPEVVQKLREAFPHIHFDLLETMENEPLLEAVMLTRLQGYLRDIPKAEEISTTHDDRIIAQHFAAAGKPDEQFPLFRAVAWATGDLALAADLTVPDHAAHVFAKALAAGKPVFCDSKELAAGIRSLGLEAICLPAVSHDGETAFKEQVAGAVVALGSEVEILDAFYKVQEKPALVIALMPGFTAAVAAKKRLAEKSPLTSIVNKGTGGGISCVLAVIRALYTSSKSQD